MRTGRGLFLVRTPSAGSSPRGGWIHDEVPRTPLTGAADAGPARPPGANCRVPVHCPRRVGYGRLSDRAPRPRCRSHGLGIGVALHGLLTTPFAVGEYTEIIRVNGRLSSGDLFSTSLVHPGHSRLTIPNRKIVGGILHNFGTMRPSWFTLTLPCGSGTDLSPARLCARSSRRPHKPRRS